MALKTTKTASIQGQSTIDNVTVIHMQANIDTESMSGSNISFTIQNQDLYEANLVVCRKDMDDFKARVHAEEDYMLTQEAEEEVL